MRRLVVPLAALGLAALGGAVLAQDGGRLPAPPSDAEVQKAAADAEGAAVRLGQKLFSDTALGAGERACVTCHENPKRPDLSLKGVTTRFPRYDLNAGRVITLQEKFAQMQERNLKARKGLPPGDARWTALELYLRGLK